MKEAAGKTPVLGGGDALSSIGQIYEPIRGHMEEMEDFLSQELDSGQPSLDKYTGHLARYRGKRLRPALVFFAAKAVGEVGRAQVEVAAAAELMHCATLVHDDILDEADVRRNVETVNRKWGNEKAVLLGDFVFTKAFEIVVRRGGLDLAHRLVSAAQEICLGEMLQIERRFDFGLDEKTYLSIIAMKTASLFRFCAGAGAALAGGSQQSVDAMHGFASGLGVAFQIVDDCLDLVGDEVLAGKSLGTDIDKGKMTLPIIHALAARGEGAGGEIERAFREGRTSPVLRKLLRDSDSLEYAFARAGEHVSEALRALDGLPPSPARQHAALLGRFVLERNW